MWMGWDWMGRDHWNTQPLIRFHVKYRLPLTQVKRCNFFIGFSYYYHMFFCPILKKFVGLGYPPKMGLTWFFLNFLLELTLHPSKFRKKHPCWLGKTSLLSNVWFWMKDCPLVPCWDYDLEAASCYPAVWLSQMPTAAPSLLLGVASTWHQRPAVLVLQKALQCTWSVKLLSRLLPTPNTVINEI